jgi:hypothetical protein
VRIRRPIGPSASPLPDGNDNRTEQKHIAITDPNTVDSARMTREQRAVLPLSIEVIQALAEQHGVCVRPLAMRRIDITTGRIDIVPIPCGPPEKTSAPLVPRKPAGCGWPNAARAGTWRPSPSSTGLHRANGTRS